jgi:hypothetical protein
MAPDHPNATAGKRNLVGRRRVIIGFAISVIVAACFRVRFGPQVENHYQCPLTGRSRLVVIRFGVTISDRTTANSVSVWADENGLPEVVAGQCGWTPAETVATRWVSAPLFGESMVPMIPRDLHGKTIILPGVTREEALQKYQTAIMTAFATNQPLWKVQQRILQAVRLRSPASA